MATIVITGASDGIGAAAAENLAKDHTVVVVGRNPAKTAAVAGRLGVEHHVCDYVRLADVRRLAADLASAHPVIDVLANNAGAIMSRRTTTVDGFETTMQVNHLAPFLLTTLLLPNLRAGRGTVVTTSSGASRLGRLDLTDLALTRGWSQFGAYGTAKLANILVTRGLQRRYGGEGLNAACFHPGTVATSFGTGNGPKLIGWFYQTPTAKVLFRTPEQGADTLQWLARGRAGVDWRPGAYYVDRREAEPPAQARDDALVDRLWDASRLLVAP